MKCCKRLRKLKWCLFLPSLIFLASCGHFGVKKENNSLSKGASQAPSKSSAKLNLATDGSDRSDSAVPEVISTYKADPKYGEVPLVVNPYVNRWISYYQGRGRRYMTNYLRRSTKYMPMMKQVLRERGLPENLIYVVFIESGFSSHAYSYASAVGFWQFIRGTGKMFHLKMNTWVDDRSDPLLSTRAAASYFQTLHNLFGDWYLALAAYNTGENRVIRAVRRTGSRDYWELVRRKKLHRETRSYVPKFIAAALIGQNPAMYGFHDVEYKEPLNFETIFVPKAITLKKLAGNMGIEHSLIKELNPKYRHDWVPVKNGVPVEIRVPQGMRKIAVAALESSLSDAPKNVRGLMFVYRVRSGDTLSGIAHKFRTRVSNLRRENNLRRRSLLRIGQRLRVPEGRGRYVSSKKRRKYKSRRTARRSSKKKAKKGYHIVRRGENLSVIAEKYGVSVRHLKRLNRLGRRTLIRMGQHLKVKSSSSPRS